MKILDKFNYNIDEYLNIKTRLEGIEKMNGNIIIEIIHIYDWYDEVFCINTSGAIINHELNCVIDHKFDKGFYAIKTIRINNITIFGYEDKYDISSYDFFSVSMNGMHNNYDLAYKEIIKNREDMFNKTKEIDSEGEKSLFDAYIFVKNIKIKSHIQYGNIEAIPFINLGNDAEAKNIDTFFKTQNLTLDLSHIINSNSRPTAIFFVKNILAVTGRQAELLAIKMAESLISAFTLTTRTNGEIYAIAMLNTKEQTACVNVLNRIYTGDLLLLGDQGFTIRKYYNSFINNNPLEFYVKLLNEAEKEHDRLYKYYKLWMILEGLAEKKNYVDKDMLKWNGENVYNKNREKVKIKGKSLDIVFELVRNHFSNENEDIFFKCGNINKAKEFLSICYQRRCCCAHHGKCYKGDPRICKPDDVVLKRCKDNNIEENFFQSKYDDKILVKFENIVYDIVNKEMISEVGTTEKSQHLVELFLSK